MEIEGIHIALLPKLSQYDFELTGVSVALGSKFLGHILILYFIKSYTIFPA